MRSDTFLKALMSTARVACCAALLSCTTRNVDPTDDTTTGATGNPTSPATYTSEPSGEDPASAPASADPLAECKEHTQNVFTKKTEAASEKTKECCLMVAKDLDASAKAGAFPDTNKWEERGECCGLLQWQGSMACTPWGPPCPPAMGVA